MHMVSVTVICIVLLLVCGILLSQGFLQSVDEVGNGYTVMASQNEDVNRTAVNADYAACLNSKIIRVELTNTGNSKLTSFNSWDIFVDYFDGEGISHSARLEYTTGTLSGNQWKIEGIYYGGQAEVFDPGILNSQECLIFQVLVDPLPAWDTTATVQITTPNGIRDTIACSVVPGDFVLTAHSETIAIGEETFYTLKEASPADGQLINYKVDVYEADTGRWPLYCENDGSMQARHLYSLAAAGTYPEQTWNVYYRVNASPGWNDNPYVSIDIIVRKANGSIREVIAQDVAQAYIATFDNWLTASTTYTFPGYSVVDPTDYLEIDYYGGVSNQGPGSNAYIMLSVDDNTLDAVDQTRIQ